MLALNLSIISINESGFLVPTVLNETFGVTFDTTFK